MDRSITTREAAQRLKIGEASVRKLCVKLGLQRVGRDWLLTQDDYDRLAATANSGPGNPSGKRRI